MNAVVTDWPSGSGNAGWPQEPTAMLMPGRVQGWPAGTQRAANAAQRLLSQAVAWWDVEQYRDGDRFLRNRGTGGELLDLRLGSSIVANSNDPQYLGVEDQGYVYLPGGLVLNSLSVADPFNNTGDLDISLHLNGNVDANNTRLIDGGGVIFHWNAGILTFVVTDSTGAQTISSTVSASAYRNIPAWFRVSYTDSTRTAVFYAATGPAAEYPTTWTTLYTGSHAGGARVATTGTAHIGNRSDGLRGLQAYVSRVLVSNAGTTVLDIDCNEIASGSATSFTAVTNQTVSVNRSSAGRKSVCVPSRHKGGKPVMLLGSDDFLECVDNWQHQLLNFDTGQSFTALVVGRLWNTPTNNGIWLSKRAYLGSNAGYALNQSGATLTGAFVASTGSFALSNLTAGATTMLAGVDRRDSPAVLLYVNATPASGTGLTSRSSWNSAPLRIGRRSDDTSYLDCEFYGAAIFRRALSPTEIKTLSDYFTGRIA